jgi:uncharacterized protein
MGHCHSSAQFGGHGEIQATDRRLAEIVAARGARSQLTQERLATQSNARAQMHSLGVWVLLAFLRFYIVFLSPFFGGACKFYPSCSNYAVEALSKHGVRRGLALAAKRLLHCRPFTQGGFDPVPDVFEQPRHDGKKLPVMPELKFPATERRTL